MDKKKSFDVNNNIMYYTVESYTETNFIEEQDIVNIRTYLYENVIHVNLKKNVIMCYAMFMSPSTILCIFLSDISDWKII